MRKGTARMRNHDSIAMESRSARGQNYADWRRHEFPLACNRVPGGGVRVAYAARGISSLRLPRLAHVRPLKSRNAPIRPLKTFFKCLFLL